MPDEPNLHTEGGADVSGDVNTGGGDFVGRDHIEGDKITVGDVRDSTAVAIGQDATANVTIVNQPFSREEIQNRRNLAVLRRTVKQFWIDGVLKHSLNQEVLIRLNMA